MSTVLPPNTADVRHEDQEASLLDDMFDLRGNTGAARTAALDGLRGLAALMVFLVHYAALIAPWLPAESLTAAGARGMHAAGHLGVYLFFVISGYLIYGSLIRKEAPFLPYMARRLRRIYPTFLVVFALYLVLSAVFPDQSKIPSDPLEAVPYILANILLLPGLFDITPIITVAWSLSYEMFFYLVMPIIIGALALRRRSTGFRLAAFGAIWLLIPITFPEHFAASAFIVGIMLVETVNAHRNRSLPGWLEPLAVLTFAAAIGMFIAVYLDIIEGPHINIWKNIVLFAASYLLFLAALMRDGALAWVFRLRFVRYFGNISYSFYLIHSLCLHVVFLIMAALMPAESTAHHLWFWALLPPALFASTIGAAGLFLLIERPFSLDGKGALSLLRRKQGEGLLTTEATLESR
ncbi:MAG: acyltransferase [Pseudomonadota bacterium]